MLINEKTIFNESSSKTAKEIEEKNDCESHGDVNNLEDKNSNSLKTFNS